MSLGAINGRALVRATVQISAWGTFWIDARLAEPEVLEGRVTCTIGGVAMSCAVISGGIVDGRAAYRLAGGAGGWGKDIPAQAYRDDSGVKFSTAISDAATAVGEAVEGVPSTRGGPHYVRAAGMASAVLNNLVPQAWRVDLDGVTRFGLRATTTYSGNAPRTRRDPGVGVIELATEDLAGLVPGVSIDGSAPATDVEYVLDETRLTARIYAGPKPNRRLDAQRRIFDSLFPQLRYSGVAEFRVVSQFGDRFNLQPVRAATGLPDLAGVRVRPGMAGLKATVVPGCLVLVAFVDNDATRPVVVGFDDPESPGWMPLQLVLGGPGALGVVRLGDAVQAGPFAGVTTFASVRVKAAV